MPTDEWIRAMALLAATNILDKETLDLRPAEDAADIIQDRADWFVQYIKTGDLTVVDATDD